MNYRFEKTVSDFLKRYDVSKEDSLIIAFSGGADSLSLMIALRRLNYTNVKGVYVNHNLRSKDEIKSEIALNKANAEKLGFDLFIKEIPEGVIKNGARGNEIGIEGEARNIRLSLLEAEAQMRNAKYILTGHNRDDRNEWEIISFFRGAVGFSTIPEYRHPYLRPLITLSHKDAITYCKSNKFKYSEDITNYEDEHLRCKVRNILIPEIEKVFPSFSKAFENRRSIYKTQDASEINIVSSTYYGIKCVEISVDDLNSSSIPERTNVIHNALSHFNKGTNGGRISLRDVKAILDIAGLSDSKTLLISGVYVFKTSYLLDKVMLIFMKQVDVNDAILNRDRAKKYAEEGVKIKVNGATKSALKHLKDKKVPRVIRPLIPLDEIK